MQIFKYARQILLTMGLVCGLYSSLVVAETKLSNEEMGQIFGNEPVPNKKCSGGFSCPLPTSGACRPQGFICLSGTCTEGCGHQVGNWTCVDAQECCNIQTREVLVQTCKKVCKWVTYNNCACRCDPDGGGWIGSETDCTAS